MEALLRARINYSRVIPNSPPKRSHDWADTIGQKGFLRV